jgi:hypothetical protein
MNELIHGDGISSGYILQIGEKPMEKPWLKPVKS